MCLEQNLSYTHIYFTVYYTYVANIQIYSQRIVVEKLNKMKESERYLNSKQAAKFLNVHVKTLLRFAAEGTIPYTKPRGRYYFAKSQLVAYINNEL